MYWKYLSSEEWKSGKINRGEHHQRQTPSLRFHNQKGQGFMHTIVYFKRSAILEPRVGFGQ